MRGGHQPQGGHMVRKKSKAQAEFILFDVLYADGTRTSNRKVPSAVVGGLEGDAPAQPVIESQDLEIATRSGRTRGPIKSITRSAEKAVEKSRRHDQRGA
jgi:hypothetical protein